MEPSKLKSLAHYGPVTALAFAGDHLFVGEGPRLKKYCWKTGQLICEQKVFKRDKIHGIVVNPDKQEVALWGGATLAVVDFTCLGPHRRMNDWITSVVFSQCDQSWLFVQTAHNTVYRIDRQFKVVDIVKCEEESVLYSGSMLPLPNGDALVGAGTVLGGVVLWQLSTRQILHTLTTHEGSIFGVVFSSDGKRVVSCSDDRSIRLWDVASGEELAVGWGHMGRIWQMMFLGDGVVSISEDCSARIWQRQGDKLSCEQVFEGHLGRNAWAGALNYGHQVMATGGADGRVRLWDIEQQSNISTHRCVDVWKDISVLLAGEALKDYTVVQNGIIAGSSKCRALFRDVRGGWSVIEDVLVDTQSCVVSWAMHNKVCLGYGHGVVTEMEVADDGRVRVTKQVDFGFEGRLGNIIPFECKGELLYLAVSQIQDELVYIQQFGGPNVATLERPGSFPPSAAAYDASTNALYVGSKHGALAIYPFEGKDLDLVTVWRCIVSDTVTTILVEGPCVYLTSYVAEYCTLSVDADDYTVRVLNMSKLGKGSIMGCKVTADGDLLLYGFRKDSFFLWNDTLQCEIVNELCGGAHRTWGLLLPDAADPLRFQFVYTKSGCLYITNGQGQQKYRHIALQEGTHGREIRAVAMSPQPGADGTRIVATASEDTSVRFCTVSPQTGRLRTHVVQRKHVSGMQSVHWTPDGKFALSSAANEELIVWRVTRHGANVYACQHARLPTGSDVPDLRIMDFAMLELADDQYVLATVYSDSAIKLWLMDLAHKSFQLLNGGAYTTCCLLNCQFVVHDAQTFLVVGATDGHVVVYNVTGTVQGEPLREPALTLQLHQSSIKSAVLHKAGNNGRYLFVSGGDDNALVVSELVFGQDGGGGVAGALMSAVPDAHIATITSVARVPRGYLSVSVDQDVKLWRLTGDDELELVDKQSTTVADTGPLDTCQVANGQTMAAFAGAGLSFWIL